MACAVATALPERLNLSLSHACYVKCAGCYNMFGADAPDLARFAKSAARFAALGVRTVTISGGDPMRVDGILAFVRELRRMGITSIKVDTVGTGFATTPRRADAAAWCGAVDILGIPLDGWDEESVSWFRRGRPHLFRETIDLLRTLDTMHGRCDIYVNTVAHARNVAGLAHVLETIEPFTCVRRWNVFQYTPTDQVADEVNRQLEISPPDFENSRRVVSARHRETRRPLEIDWASTSDRLGKYLLVNSNGDAWMPDARGNTVRLGSLFGREEDVLSAWSEARA